MGWLSASSLRFRLTLLVLLAILPARGLGVYTAWEMRNFARAEALQEALRLARIASAAGERLVEGTHQMLVVLARLPEVRSQNAAACSALLARVLKPYPYYTNLAASRPNGETFCSAVPFAAPLNVADRAYFRRALETRAFAVGEYSTLRNLGVPPEGNAQSAGESERGITPCRTAGREIPPPPLSQRGVRGGFGCGAWSTQIPQCRVSDRPRDRQGRDQFCLPRAE